MAPRPIEVTFMASDTVQAPPLQHRLEVDRGDTVTWNFVPKGDPGGQKEIVFLTFMPADGSDHLPGRSPFSNTLLPNSRTIGPGTVSNTAAAGLYTYKVLNNTQRLNWDTGLFIAGSFSANFGGIIIRDPGGSGTPSTDG